MNWITLKRLHQIYQEGKTKANKTLLKDPDIEHLLNHTKELFLHGDYIKKKEIFDKYYRKHHLDNFIKYKEFLQRNNLENPQTRFEEKDIITLIDIFTLITIETKVENKELKEILETDNDKEIIEFISTKFFENEKYLLNRKSLANAVLQLILSCKISYNIHQ